MRVYGTEQRGAIARGGAAAVARSQVNNGRADKLPAGERMVMKRLPLEDRPREKLERVGVGALGDNELLAILLGEGSRHQNALELANELLQTSGGLCGLTRTDRSQLRLRRGVGTTKAARISAAIELGRRTLLEWPGERPRLATSRELAAYLVPRYGSSSIEQFGIVLLDSRFRLIRTTLLSVGVLDGSSAEPRDVYREAIAGGAAAVVLFHNHPSGDPTPSGDDILVTKRMFEAGRLMGVTLVDHVVLADNRYFSFSDHKRRHGGTTEAARAMMGNVAWRVGVTPGQNQSGKN